MAESSKLETWVRSYQKAAELGYIQSLFDSGYGSILLPYEFEWNYSNSTYLPYWQVYDSPLELCYKSDGAISTVESLPTDFENNNGWVFPANAYASDDNLAYASPPAGTSYWITYKNFTFDIPPDAKIEKVEVGVEWYTSNSTYELLYGSISWDGGKNWHEITFPTQSTENLIFLDFSSATSWDSSKLSRENLRVKLRAYKSSGGGGGCYPSSTYILTWNSTHYIFKSPEEMKIGDLVVCYKEKLKFCKVVGTDKHFGDWDLVELEVGKSKMLLTDDHPVLIPGENIVKAGKLKEGTKLYYLKGGNVTLLQVSRILKKRFRGIVYDVKLNESAILFSKLADDKLVFENLSSVEAIDMLIPKSTIYVDSVRVRVTYKTERKFKCPLEIFKNYFKQKISLISLNYLKNYLKDFENLAKKAYPVDFLDGISPQVLEITDDYVLVKSSEQLSFKRSFKDALGNEINITRSTYLTSKIYTSFGKAIKKAIDILEKDLLGKCVKKEICDYSDEEGLKKSLANLAQSLSEKDLNLTFNLKNFDSGTAFIEVKIEDNTSSYVRYNFPKDSMNESYLGLDFMVKVGTAQTASDQYKAEELKIFKECSDSHLGILGSKSDICNYFKEGSKFAVDEDGADPYLKGKCSDSTGDYEDVCFDSMLYEYKPLSAYNLCYFEKIKCDECKDGACKPSSCVDHDEGLEYFVPSYVEYDGKELYDRCEDENTLVEAYCEDGWVKTQTYDCKLGCENGACKIDYCKLLADRITQAFGTKCGDEDYDPVADLNKDREVNMTDSTLLSRNYRQDWCEEMLSKTESPCYCDQLKERIDLAMGSSCGSPNYDPVADLNKDGSVNILDSIEYASLTEAECKDKLEDTSSPCIKCSDVGGVCISPTGCRSLCLLNGFTSWSCQTGYSDCGTEKCCCICE